MKDKVALVMEECEAAFGSLHMVSNNAAHAAPNKPVTSLSEDEWDKCMGVTLKGVWLCMKYQLPLIESSGSGAIVNIASVSGMQLYLQSMRWFICVRGKLPLVRATTL